MVKDGWTRPPLSASTRVGRVGRAVRNGALSELGHLLYNEPCRHPLSDPQYQKYLDRHIDRYTSSQNGIFVGISYDDTN
jgi:hypothetical protein